MILMCANAHALTGVDLYQACKSASHSSMDLVCIAYVHGFLDGFQLGRFVGTGPQSKYCPPKDGVSVDQGRLIIEKYLREHPQDLHTQAGLMAASAMMDAFPCKH